MKESDSNRILRTLYIETGKQKVAEVLFRFPEREFSLSDLAKEAGVGKANIGTILEELDKAELITIVRLSKMWRIKANQSNWNFIRLKIVWNLNYVYQSGLIEFLNERYRNPKCIVLFGSFRRGEDISTSDIDIAIETESTEEYGTVRHKALSVFERMFGRSIQIHLVSRDSIDLNIFNNIANGIVLSGFLEVRP